MRMRWKIFGGGGIAGLSIAAFLIAHGGVVRGETSNAASSSTSTTSSSDPGVPSQDPNTPYPLGPGAIPYEQLSAADKAAVEAIQETVETSQPASSYQAWAAATAATGKQADAEIAARSVGLVGTSGDGVVP
jgi:hypothetical protein